MREVSLSKFGLLTVRQAAELRGVDRKTIQRWVGAGHVTAVPLDMGGKHGAYLVIEAEVKAFVPEPAGRRASETKPTRRAKR